MKQQTAMQQLLAYVNHNGQSWRGISADMIEKDFMPLEKEQIVNAHYEGQCNNQEGYPIEIAANYYSKTYENPNT